MTPGRIIRRELSEKIKNEVLTESDGCRYCGDVSVPLQVDHFVPLSRGGSNARDNLVAACVSCNSQKRAMLFHEWRCYRQTHGMPWPPIASHGTALEHYQDRCESCSMAYEGDDFSLNFTYPAEEIRRIRLDPGTATLAGASHQFRAYYHCPADHRWTCLYIPFPQYFSDCVCIYCQTLRDDEEA